MMFFAPDLIEVPGATGAAGGGVVAGKLETVVVVTSGVVVVTSGVVGGIVVVLGMVLVVVVGSWAAARPARLKLKTRARNSIIVLFMFPLLYSPAFWLTIDLSPNQNFGVGIYGNFKMGKSELTAPAAFCKAVFSLPVNSISIISSTPFFPSFAGTPRQTSEMPYWPER